MKSMFIAAGDFMAISRRVPNDAGCLEASSELLLDNLQNLSQAEIRNCIP